MDRPLFGHILTAFYSVYSSFLKIPSIHVLQQNHFQVSYVSDMVFTERERIFDDESFIWQTVS